MTVPQEASPSDADDVERHPCPRCKADPGSPCRSHSGAVAGTYHTGRFTKMPRLAELLRAPTPADRGPGQPWRPSTPVPLALAPDTPTADICIGYARCSTLTQELQSQLDALTKHDIPRDKVFSEKVTTCVRVRPQFEAALAPPSDHETLLNDFLIANGDWKKYHTWFDETTHAIHESQALRIERIHEALAHETSGP
ncbi:zinc finger domain-containing protein [Streptomyces mirabilis]|uniref:zinc finger domain-containing protein n=1 Tax=Streptomyces mirabilis TaxID=68239 RepID=UPI00365C9365